MRVVRKGIGERKQPARRPGNPRQWLMESERLFEEFRQLTPYKFKPFTRTFNSFAEYERWRRAQRNPWYR